MNISIEIKQIEPEFEPINVKIKTLNDFNILKYILADSIHNESGNRDDIKTTTVQNFKVDIYRIFDKESIRQRIKGIKGI